jgi:hypothetical protein
LFRQNLFDPPCGALSHASCPTAGTEASSLATESDPLLWNATIPRQSWVILKNIDQIQGLEQIQ